MIMLNVYVLLALLFSVVEQMKAAIQTQSKKLLLFTLCYLAIFVVVGVSPIVAQDGSLDMSFADFRGGFNATNRGTALQADGKILVGGDFTTYQGIACNHITRLNTDGTIVVPEKVLSKNCFSKPRSMVFTETKNIGWEYKKFNPYRTF
jgi:hypothetical protein